MHIQTLDHRRNVIGILSLAIHFAAKALQSGGPGKLWTHFDLTKPEILRAGDLPNHLLRDLGLPQRREAPLTARQMLELHLH